jgi:hypothetical protein
MLAEHEGSCSCVANYSGVSLTPSRGAVCSVLLRGANGPSYLPTWVCIKLSPVGFFLFVSCHTLLPV